MTRVLFPAGEADGQSRAQVEQMAKAAREAEAAARAERERKATLLAKLDGLQLRCVSQ